ncbi:MAG: hypothetical protein BAJATHORv1_30317 [Candidatus Thorarchaeota archaeon]|nr:MAG: hypothetical protein BAJATHORv1_30317 [Candidatus Thorarchaeota archaeon]
MGVYQLKQLLANAENDPSNIDKWIELGEYAIGRYVTSYARIALENALKLDPNNVRVLDSFGKVLNRDRHLTEAAQIYQRAIDLDSENPSLLTGLAVVRGHQMNSQLALDLVGKALQIDPGFPWAVHVFCNLMKSQSGPEALSIAERGIESNPQSALNWAVLFSLIENTDSDRAKKAYENAISLLNQETPDNIRRALGVLSDSEYSRDIVQKMEEIILEDDANLGVICFLAMRYVNTDNLARMKELIDIASAYDPENQLVTNSLLLYYISSKQPMKAVMLKTQLQEERGEDPILKLLDMTSGTPTTRESYTLDELRDAISRNPEHIKLRETLVNTLISNGDFEAAYQAVSDMDELKLEDAVSHFMIAELAEKMGMQEMADKHATLARNKAITIQSRAHLASWCSRENDYSQLEEVTLGILKSDPRMRKWHAVLGRTRLILGNYEGAIESFRIGAKEGVVDSVIYLANEFKNQGSTTEANKMLENCLVDSPTTTNQLIGNARIYMSLGRWFNARECLEQAVEKDPLQVVGWKLLVALSINQGGKEQVEKVLTQYNDIMGTLANLIGISIELETADDVMKRGVDKSELQGAFLEQVVNDLIEELPENES